MCTESHVTHVRKVMLHVYGKSCYTCTESHVTRVRKVMLHVYGKSCYICTESHVTCICFREQCINLNNAAYCSEALSQPDLVTSLDGLKQSLSKLTQTGEYLTSES